MLVANLANLTVDLSVQLDMRQESPAGQARRLSLPQPRPAKAREGGSLHVPAEHSQAQSGRVLVRGLTVPLAGAKVRLRTSL